MAFEEAVDDYLELCKEEGKEPEKPFKASFNVRTGTDLHRKAALPPSPAPLAPLNAFGFSFNRGRSGRSYWGVLRPPWPVEHYYHFGGVIGSLAS